MTSAFLKAQEYIDNIPKFIKKNTMGDTCAFYDKLGAPGKGAKVIHVAGTNGKGSVCACLQSVLMEAGYRAGMFTSPHLVDIRERIRLDRDLISEEDFVRIFEKVKETLSASAYHPSYFEYLYFMAMLYFEEKAPDFIILETGLGGRLDATNSFPSPCISIITEIGLDHMEYLGETEEKIAAEKAGIVKKGIPLVYFAKNKTVADVLEKAAKRADSKAFAVKPSEIFLQKCDEKGIDFSYQSGYYEYSTFHLRTKAFYQQENAALCMKALSVLQEKGLVKLTEEFLRRGLEKMVWEGRMEEILPDVYLDGAHNIDGIRAFLTSVRYIRKNSREREKTETILLYSTLADKSYQDVTEEILRAGIFDEIVLTQVRGARGLSVKKLSELFREKNPVIFEEAEEAFAYCLKRWKMGTKIYVTGSLYLIGQIKDFMEGSKGHD